MVRYKKFRRDLERIYTYPDKDGQEFMRLLVTVYFNSLPEDAEEQLKTIRCFPARYTDGSAAIDAACLVPWVIQTCEIEQIVDNFVDAMREFLGKPVEQIMERAWAGGHSDDRWDDLLTPEELAIVDGVERRVSNAVFPLLLSRVMG